jgi:hypothetical protein
VLHDWRANTYSGFQRETGTPRPWFNSRVSLDNGDMVNTLIARARLAGRTITAQFNRGEPWREVPDPIVLLRTGTPVDRVDPNRARPPLETAALCELDGLVQYAGAWLQFVNVLPDAVAEACGVPRDRVQEVRLHLAFLAQRERSAAQMAAAR